MRSRSASIVAIWSDVLIAFTTCLPGQPFIICSHRRRCQSTRMWWRSWGLLVMPLRLSPDQRRMLSLLATAGRDGIVQEQLNALGFEPDMIAELVNQGIATLTSSRAYSGGKM